MCGRYVRRGDKQRIAKAFHVRGEIDGISMPPDDYNVAPSTFQPVIRENKEDGSREMILMRWGLIPFFAKDAGSFKMSTINAKAETVPTAPTWRTPFARRRCLIPASAFYEWKRIDAKNKQPYAFSVAGHPHFAFAGLWDAWKDKDGLWLQSYAIVTTEANELMAPVHNRMPVILQARDYDRWLSRDQTEHPPVDLLRPHHAGEMTAHPVDPCGQRPQQ